MTEQPNAAATALQLTDTASLHRFLRAISSNLSDASTLHLYEHRNNTFSIHGDADVQLATTLLPSGAHTPSELPSTSSTSATPTLLLDPRTARTLTAAALFTAGRKAVVWAVSSDGRITSSMDGTPGCPASLSNWLGERPDDGVVLCARPAMRNSLPVLGLAAWDPSAATLRVTDLYDNDTQSALETVFISTNARELVIPDDIPEFDLRKLGELVDRCSIALTTRKKKCFDPTDTTAMVTRLTGKRLQHDALFDGKVTAGATAALLDYCQLTNDMSLEGRVRVSELAVAGSMQLDTGAMRALNILPFPGDGGKTASLYGLLNRNKTSMGSRLLRRWLCQPLQSIDDINSRFNVVEAFVGAPDCRQTVRNDHLGKLPDLNLLCRRFTKDNGAKASLQDVVRLYQCSIRIPLLCAELINAAENGILQTLYAEPLRKLAEELSNFEALVETTVDLEKIDNGEFVVNPSIDPELGKLHAKQDAILDNIKEEFDTIRSRLGDTLKLERKDTLGYVFRLTRKEERAIRGKKQYSVLETRKDGVRFQTSSLRKLSNAYENIASEYAALEKDMRIKTLEVASTYVDVFVDVAAFIAELDVLCSFAFVSEGSRSHYVRPKMLPAGHGLKLKQARHPIVEENLSDGIEFIANDIDLTRSSEDAMQDEEETGGSLVLVTGPNMGGKSTYIRSAGVLTLMAHIGMFVPADEAQVSITDRIFARVGAADNQHRAVSTFMSEMLETATILRFTTPNSLVIIDELGRGTGTTDGYGLAYAISKHIATKLRSACLFASHFYELTALADEAPHVRNKHVSAVTDGAAGGRLTFLYEVRDGACDQSFGVHVAEMAHFPTCVVDMARAKADEMEGCGAAAKRVRVANVSDAERECGLQLMRDFESAVDELKTDSEENMKAALIKARTLKNELLSKKNGYVDALLA